MHPGHAQRPVSVRRGSDVVPAGVWGTKQSIATSAGFHIFNGDGTGTDFVTFVINGMNQNVPSPVAITYTLKPDCTGTFSVHNGPNFDIFVAVDGSGLSLIGNDPGGARMGKSYIEA